MYLVDTSVWIDYFREKDNSSVRLFQSILDNHIPFGITGIIYQEILQGAKNEFEFEQLTNYLSTQRFFFPKNLTHAYHEAARLFFNARRKGITLRSTNDCLIAQIAIEHQLTLLHNDKDFKEMAKIAPRLKLAEE